MCNEYSGYTNYQTWNVSLWLDNDQGLYLYFTERAASLVSETASLANEIEEWIKEHNPLADGASTFCDLMGHALGMVDWFEIAEGFIEAAQEQMEG